MMLPARTLAPALLLVLTLTSVGEAQPTFRSGVDLVSVTAVVSDRSGRPVPELTPEDFEVFDDGEPRPIIEFWSDDSAALSMTLLIDVSGSMQVGSKMTDARAAANFFLAHLRPGQDEAAVFAFDTQLRQVRSYSTDPTRLEASMQDFTPFGATSLYDAIAETARLAAARSIRHRAVVVLSDGVDTKSTLTAPEVSGIASAIDVPVYLVALVSPLDHPDAPTSSSAAEASRLRDLARWTGGGVHFVSGPAEASQIASQLISELRQQYVLAFEPVGTGWRRLEVRAGGRQVRTRSAYQVDE